MKAIELERSDDRMSTQMRGGGPSHPEAAPSQSPRENDSSTKRADRGNTTVPRSTVVRREMNGDRRIKRRRLVRVQTPMTGPYLLTGTVSPYNDRRGADGASMNRHRPDAV